MRRLLENGANSSFVNRIPDENVAIEALVREFALPHGAFELELTESVLMVNADSTIEQMRRVSRLGVGIAVDDFGTGYSSLSYLKRLPIQRLKIDDGCYEIRGTDAQGRTFKAKIDPETLKVLKMKPVDHQRARERDRDRDGEGEGAARHARPPQPDGAGGPSPLPSPLSVPGIAPRGQTE